MHGSLRRSARRGPARSEGHSPVRNEPADTNLPFCSQHSHARKHGAHGPARTAAGTAFGASPPGFFLALIKTRCCRRGRECCVRCSPRGRAQEPAGSRTAASPNPRKACPAEAPEPGAIRCHLVQPPAALCRATETHLELPPAPPSLPQSRPWEERLARGRSGVPGATCLRHCTPGTVPCTPDPVHLVLHLQHRTPKLHPAPAALRPPTGTLYTQHGAPQPAPCTLHTPRAHDTFHILHALHILNPTLQTTHQPLRTAASAEAQQQPQTTRSTRASHSSSSSSKLGPRQLPRGVYFPLTLPLQIHY